jgi:NAD(P)-dependent dehydrogenase (short-subunit alcohol dehydrogenase family)
MRLENKITVITGAGSGMGKAVAKLFASEGAKILCADISGKQDAVAADGGYCIGFSGMGAENTGAPGS